MHDKPEKVKESLAFERELVQAPEGSEGNLKPDPEGNTQVRSAKGKPTNSGYLILDPRGVLHNPM